MKTIWKYPLEVTDYQEVLLPNGGVVLSVQAQNEVICLWALVDPDPSIPKSPMGIRIVGTGHLMEDGDWHKLFQWCVGTVQLAGGSLVFHVFLGGAK